MNEMLALLSEQVPLVQTLIGLAVLLAVALLINFILKHVIIRAITKAIHRKSVSLSSGASCLATAAPLMLVSQGIGWVPHLPEWIANAISHIAEAFIILSVAMAIVKVLTYLNNVYERRPEAQNRPIKSFVQVVKIVVLSIAVILMIAVLIDQSPLLLFSGLGAITAVLLLVFKDTILSLVATIQLATGDMLRVGDWIEMPEMGADGDVIDISLHTVKVQNFDQTITTIPTHRLVSQSFRNWRGMVEGGGRRIKRPLTIDQNTIRFLSDEEVVALKKFRVLKDFLAARREEMADWNKRELAEEEEPVNARRFTNIGVLRAYIYAYLQWHPQLATEDFLLLVRQLQPGPQGLPIEIYCFTDTIDWSEFESIQADIFDHMIAILPEFDLRLFQEPSGSDFGAVSQAG